MHTKSQGNANQYDEIPNAPKHTRKVHPVQDKQRGRVCVCVCVCRAHGTFLGTDLAADFGASFGDGFGS